MEGGTSRLSYELRSVAPGGKITEPLITINSAAFGPDMLITKLPGIAEKLRSALLSKPSVVTAPPLAGGSIDTLTRIGACADTTDYSPEQLSFLLKEGKQTPLAAELALSIARLRADPDQAAPYTRLLLRSMPRNTQTLGMIGYAVPIAIKLDAARVYALSEQYKDNYVLASAATWVARANGDWSNDLKFSGRCAKNAPANPDALLTAASSLSAEAERLRKSRQSNDMDATTAARVEPIYAEWYRLTRAATRSDPMYGRAYLRLATAATFAGDETEADAAMTMARKRFAESPYETYFWALEMYQPKWGGDPARLTEVAREAADALYKHPQDAVAIYKRLGVLKLTSEQKHMGDRIYTESTAAIAKNPDDNFAHYLRGWVLSQRGDVAGATADFEVNVRILPKDAAVHFELGRNYTDIQQFSKAETAFREADTLRPHNAETLYYIGYCLKRNNKLPEAEKYLRKSLALSPEYAPALASLGTIYGMESRDADAISCYEKALHLAPFLPEANVNLAACYTSVGRPQDAINLGERFLRYFPGDANMQRVLDEARVSLVGNKKP